MKDCPTCDTPRDRSEFGGNRSRPGGLHGECRYCAADRYRRYRDANREKERERSRRYRQRRKAQKEGE